VGYLQSVKRLYAADNLGGVHQLKVCRKADIVEIPNQVAGVIYGDIIFAGGTGFVTWEVTLETSHMQSQGNSTKEGSSKRNSLSFTIPKGRIDLTRMLLKAEDDEFIVLYVENGKQKIFGQLHAPVLFGFNHDSGKQASDLNSYQCRFYYDGPDNVFEYEGATPSAPEGPAPAIVMFNGSAIASLQPGETLNILSDYEFTEYFVTS